MKVPNQASLKRRINRLRSSLFKARGLRSDIAQQFGSLRHSVEILQRSIDSTLIPELKIGETIRVVFLAHHPTSWSATRPVVERMLRDERFAVTVISLPHYYLMCQPKVLDGEPTMHDVLTEQGIPHIRVAAESIEQCPILLKAIKPHAIFRQTPWDHDLPISLSGKNLSFARLCYIPYGYMTAAIQQDQFNQEFHWSCYQIFWPDSVHQVMSEKYSDVGSPNSTVTGYPKFDAIASHIRDRKSNEKDSPFHLVWAPHWSFQDSLIRFGAFWDVAEYLYGQATELSGMKITLRPHPVLRELIRSGDDPRLAKFLKRWIELPNTAFSEEYDYSQLFAESNALITDGISFLSEYQLFDKPLLFYSRTDSIGFNEAGTRLLDGVYRVHTPHELHCKLVDIMNGIEDLQVVKSRRETATAIRPYSGCAAENIIETLYSKLTSEAKH